MITPPEGVFHVNNCRSEWLVLCSMMRSQRSGVRSRLQPGLVLQFFANLFHLPPRGAKIAARGNLAEEFLWYARAYYSYRYYFLFVITNDLRWRNSRTYRSWTSASPTQAHNCTRLDNIPVRTANVGGVGSSLYWHDTTHLYWFGFHRRGWLFALVRRRQFFSKFTQRSIGSCQPQVRLNQVLRHWSTRQFRSISTQTGLADWLRHSGR